MGVQKREQGDNALTTQKGWNPKIGNLSDVPAVIAPQTHVMGGSDLELG